jgi:mono/diheme cytochrome c family protein
MILTLGCVGMGCADASITPQARIQGRKIWSERCVNCHGATGKGDGPGSGPLDPKPRDFSARTWQLQTADEQMARVIVDGGRAAGLSDQMAANPDLGSKPAVVAALIQHIRSLAP